MQLTPFNGFLSSRYGLSRVASLRRLRQRNVRQGSQSAGQWVCRRCHSQLARATSPSTLTLYASNLSKPHSPRTFAKAALSSTSRRNDSPKSSEPEPTSEHSQPPSEPLPSHSESLRSPLSHRFTHLMDTMQSTLVKSTQHLNTLTGYTGIESLKALISAQETHLQRTRSALSAARAAYTQAISQRSSSQREVNELLQRKNTWTPQDLERFTQLYRSDHANELNESRAHEALVKAEREAEEAGQSLSETILKRYHEEQIWSDKIRRMSTWGTWGLMGVNVLLFLVFQIGVEPWRRGRLVRGFEEKVKEALEREVKVNVNLDAGRLGEVESVEWDSMHVNKVDGSVRTVGEGVERRPDKARSGAEALEKGVEEVVEREFAENMEVERSIDQVVDDEIISEKGRMDVLTDKVKDLFSERQVVVRQWDLTTLALEGVAAGMAAVGLTVVLLRLR
ncbi:MAG: hypothetical protein LQ338_004877 [Usnochroma carphineum]|nr:MAG: hypothetical protein LQ338_004877 [Usnochroma carphineum]